VELLILLALIGITVFLAGQLSIRGHSYWLAPTTEGKAIGGVDPWIRTLDGHLLSVRRGHDRRPYSGCQTSSATLRMEAATVPLSPILLVAIRIGGEIGHQRGQ